MGLTNEWQRKNKKEHGVTDVVKVKESEGSTFDINVGSGHLLKGIGVDKRSRMKTMRNNITDEDKELLLDVIKLHSSEMLLFDDLRTRNFPLEYLVALDLTTEEDIQSYNIMRQRGIDITDYVNNRSDKIEIDNGYLSEIEVGETNLPPLKKLDGTVIEEFVGGRGLHLKQGMTYEDKEDYIKVKEELDKKNAKIKELEEQLSNVKMEVLEEDYNEFVDDFEEDIEDKNSLESILSQLSNDISENKTVYITGKDRGIYLEGYTIKYTTSLAEIETFIEGTENLLILTNYIKEDRTFLEEIARWLNKMEDTDSNVLVVSERGSKIQHNIILENVVINKEGLDNYFSEFE